MMPGKLLSADLEKLAGPALAKRVGQLDRRIEAMVEKALEPYERERRLELAALRAHFDQAVAAIYEREAR